MIIDLKENDLKKINELKEKFSFVLKESDLFINPFSKYILYIVDDNIIGFINYYLIYDKIEIANFNVLDEFQNKGIGQKLLSKLIDKYNKKVVNITLEVKESNKKAIYLYEKNGFIKKAIREGYYNGVDGILMERSMEK